MFCPNCGANVPENANNCGNCGAPLQQAPEVEIQADVAVEAEQPVFAPEQPVEAFEQPVEAPTITPQPLLKKGKFISKLAPKGVKLCSIFTIIATVLVIAAMVASYFSTINTPVDEIPLVSVGVEAMEDFSDFDADEIDDLKDELEDKVELLEEEYEYHEDELTSKEKAAVEDFIDVANECVDSISISNIKKLSDVAIEVAELENDAFDSEDVSIEDISEGVGIAISALMYVILGFMLLPLIFTVFGGFFKKTGLVITGLIFSIFYTFIFCGALFAAIVIALHIALIVLNSIVNSAYKKYRKSVQQ